MGTCKHKLTSDRSEVLSYFNDYSQFLPFGHLTITNTPKIRAAAKFPANINYRLLTEIIPTITDSHY